MSYMTVAGVVREPDFPSLVISATANGRDTLTCDILSLDGAYRPALDDEVIYVEDADGTSTTSLLIGTGNKIFTTQASLVLVVGERVRAYSAADPLKWMEGKISSYAGTTLVVSMDTTNGAGTFADWIIARRGFGGTINDPVERGLGDIGAAPITTRINCLDFNALADHRVLNITIPPGTLKAALQVLVTYLAPAGVTLDLDQVTGPSLGEVRLFCKTLITALNTVAGNWVWEIDYYKILRVFDPTTRAAPFNIAAGDGHVIGDVTVGPTRTGYTNRPILLYNHDLSLVWADDFPEQAAHGIWEVFLRDPETEDVTAAQNLVNTYLLQHTPTPKKVVYPTNGKGLQPGQIQTINLPTRNLNNTFLITEVVATEVAWSGPLDRVVTAIEGSIYQPGWRDVYAQWGGGGGAAVAISGGGGSAAGRRVYWLGGDAQDYVQSPTPDWVPAGSAQATIDTIAMGGTVGLVIARLRATAGTVQARLWNASDSTWASAPSAAVASTTWQTVPFSAALVNGSKVYEIWLLPSLADTDVALGSSYLE